MYKYIIYYMTVVLWQCFIQCFIDPHRLHFIFYLFFKLVKVTLICKQRCGQALYTYDPLLCISKLVLIVLLTFCYPTIAQMLQSNKYNYNHCIERSVRFRVHVLWCVLCESLCIAMLLVLCSCPHFTSTRLLSTNCSDYLQRNPFSCNDWLALRKSEYTMNR